MRAFSMICLAVVAATGLSACASDGGYASRGDRYDRYESPRERCERDRKNDAVAGTVVGAGVGALAGSAIAGNSSNTAGTIAGGVAGAVIGNQVAKGPRC